MAHFTLLRASEGLWVGVVTQAEFWALDQGRFKSINGDDGGTWNPAAPIIIGGAGLQIAGGITFSGGGTITDPVIEGTLTANDDVILGEDATDDVTVNGTTHFTSPVFFDDDVTVGTASDDALTVNSTSGFVGPVTISGNFSVPVNGGATASIARPLTLGNLTTTGTVLLRGSAVDVGASIGIGWSSGVDTLQIDATTTVIGAIEFRGQTEFTTGDLVLGSDVSLEGPITPGTGGLIRHRWQEFNSDTNMTAATHEIASHSASATEAHVADLLSAGAEDGDMITIYNESTYSVYVRNNGAALRTMGPADSDQRFTKGVFIYSTAAGGWRVLEYYMGYVVT